jgi:hypothetical protein
MASSSDFLKLLNSPLVSKGGAYSDLKSPYASPFLLKEMGIQYMSSINHKDHKSTTSSELQNKVLNHSLFSLSLLSPQNPQKERDEVGIVGPEPQMLSLRDEKLLRG